MSEKQKILIADDDTDIANMMASVLRLNNYEVAEAFDGEECLQMAQSTDFDLVLLDVHMPKLEGYEVIKQLKRMPHLKHTPIVFLSGYRTAPDDIETGYMVGGTEYWKKPMATEEFEVRVRAVLRIAEAEKKLREMQEGFISMIVHDLRGPLSAVVGFADIFAEERGNFAQEYVEMHDEIGRAARRMLNIVTDFLEITRLETGELNVQRTQGNLRDIIERGVAKHSSVQREKSIEVNTDIGDLPTLYMDPELMEKAIDQLLDNAFRFTPANGFISISAVTSPVSVVVSVSDTGIGIPQAAIPLLFDKMRITTPASKRSGSGTGLGLPICKGIIEAHGGTISVQSQEGKGSTFTIILPLQTA